MKTAEQELLDAMMSLADSLGYTVYPYKQLDDVDYPFLEMVETEDYPEASKRGAEDFGIAVLIVHGWGGVNDRTTLSAQLKSLINKTRRIKGVYYNYTQQEQNTNTTISNETSTGGVLVHGIGVYQYQYSRRNDNG